jgi:hypothetical protein
LFSTGSTDPIQRGKGKSFALFFGTFLRTTKSLIKINFLKDNIEFFKLRHHKVGIDIFFFFSSFKHFRAIFFHALNILEQLAFKHNKVNVVLGHSG